MLNINYNTVCCNLPFVYTFYTLMHTSFHTLRPAFICKLVLHSINLFLLVRGLDVINSKKDYTIYGATIDLFNFIGDINVKWICILLVDYLQLAQDLKIRKLKGHHRCTGSFTWIRLKT